MSSGYVSSGTQYDEYMRLQELLNLQRRPEDWAHRDELRFQVIHQATELLLKLASHEIKASAMQVVLDDGHDEAARLVARAAHDILAATALLEPLADIRPVDFQHVRPVLGTGSGAQSPGWQSVRGASNELSTAFAEVCTYAELLDLYEMGAHTPTYRLAEAMIDLDQRISLWRARHYELLTRIVGEDAVGTAGTPVSALKRRIHDRLFPSLWRIRTELSLR